MTAHAAIQEPKVALGRMIRFDGRPDEITYATSPGEIIRHFRSFMPCTSNVDDRRAIAARRDAALAEFCDLHAQYVADIEATEEPA